MVLVLASLRYAGPCRVELRCITLIYSPLRFAAPSTSGCRRRTADGGRRTRASSRLHADTTLTSSSTGVHALHYRCTAGRLLRPLAARLLRGGGGGGCGGGVGPRSCRQQRGAPAAGPTWSVGPLWARAPRRAANRTQLALIQ